MLQKHRGLQSRVTSSCKIGGSSSHCIDLHNHAWISFGQKQASMEFCSIYHNWEAADSQDFNVVIVKIWLKTALSYAGPDNSGAFEQQSRLSYCEICADTCFRLRGDNLNENPPFYRAYGRPKAKAQTHEVTWSKKLQNFRPVWFQ